MTKNSSDDSHNEQPNNNKPMHEDYLCKPAVHLFGYTESPFASCCMHENIFPFEELVNLNNGYFNKPALYNSGIPKSENVSQTPQQRLKKIEKMIDPMIASGAKKLPIFQNRNSILQQQTGKEALLSMKNRVNENSRFGVSKTSKILSSRSVKKELKDNKSKSDYNKSRYATRFTSNQNKVLSDWYAANSDMPYASDEQVAELAVMTNLCEKSVRKWLSNKRSRNYNTNSLGQVVAYKKKQQLSLIGARQDNSYNFEINSNESISPTIPGKNSPNGSIMYESGAQKS